MRAKWAILLVAVLLLSTALVDGTLSKGSKKKDEEKADKKGKSVSKQSDGGSNDELELDEKLKAEILEHHDELDASKSKRKFAKLGYVTPWNGHGYDVAKWTTEKYTHISPVWFQLTPFQRTSDLSCQFSGEHDIDRGWLEDLRKNNSDVKIVPRFILEMKDPKMFERFLTTDIAHVRCADQLALFLERNQFDGMVFEFWLQVLVATRGQGSQYLIEMTEMFSRRLKRKNLLFIVPLTPPVRTIEFDGKSFLPPEYVGRLIEAVDYLNLMTYDYSGGEVGGISPIQWIQTNVHLFLAQNPEFASKLLVGLNYYGHCVGDISDTIMGGRFVELLKEDGKRLYWDDRVKESVLVWGNSRCWFPTRRSLESRLQLVEEEKLGGVGIWELGQGLDSFTSLL
ncbi:Chitinase domain-containing protein 1 [Aphelenchoides fujianensis]|nr:Chitinase domain-containing protein 1 [Aphelenchoides fujianensis]